MNTREKLLTLFMGLFIFVVIIGVCLAGLYLYQLYLYQLYLYQHRTQTSSSATPSGADTNTLEFCVTQIVDSKSKPILDTIALSSDECPPNAPVYQISGIKKL